jgi:hypothetical protein
MKHKVANANRTTSDVVIGKNGRYRVEIKFVNARLHRAYLESKTEDPLLHKWLTRAFDDISKNPHCGIFISKQRTPKYYIQKHYIKNLWKYDLPKGWRLLYSISEEEVWIIALILEWLAHPQYERRFGY